MSQGSGYKKVDVDKRRGPKPRKHFDATGGVTCKACFDLRNKNQELRAENLLLRSQLETARSMPKKTPVGAHTPSSRIDFKANSKEESILKRGGAKVGHKGVGRKSATRESADESIRLKMVEKCGGCDVPLKLKDISTSSNQPVRADLMMYCNREKSQLRLAVGC